MQKINIKNKFLFFILFNIFYSVFYLYYKHEVGNDTSISEWLINYQGGFTRRGLGGEINIFLAKITTLNLRDAIFFFQSFIHIIYLLFVYFFLKNIKLNIFQIFALFSPLFLLYPIAELEALGRKEILIFLFFVSILLLCEKKFNPIYINSFVFLFFPILTLIWEEITIFAPFFCIVIIYENKLVSFKNVLKKLLIIFFPTILTLLFIFLNPLSLEGHSQMCDFLKNIFDEKCYMSAELLIINTIYFDTFDVHQEVNFFPEYFRYIMIFLIGFLPLHLSINKNKFINEENFITKNFRPIWLFFTLYFPVLLLFAFGHDWGRWMHIMYSLSILLYFYLLKNSLIENIFYENFLSKLISKKKFLLILVFFIFAFFWNPKTLISGDVATNSLYKIIYNSSKIIFNYDSIRIFQNNPIIIFHKKFIE